MEGFDNFCGLKKGCSINEISPYPLELSNSSNIEPGEFVMAIGNPFGLEGSITHGIVSATGRVLPTEEGFSIPNVIQTDAPLNPGNSSSPLLDLSGQQAVRQLMSKWLLTKKNYQVTNIINPDSSSYIKQYHLYLVFGWSDK